jgi:hypothetical protein
MILLAILAQRPPDASTSAADEIDSAAGQDNSFIDDLRLDDPPINAYFLMTPASLVILF